MASINQTARERVARIIAEYIDEHLGDVPESELGRIEQAFEIGSGWRPDYHVQGRAFTKKYLGDNYRKALAVLDRINPNTPATLLDLGSGSGAVPLAIMARAAELGDLCGAVLEVTLIDRSASQLRVARELIEASRQELGLHVHVVPLVADVAELTAFKNRFDIISAAHIITENPDEGQRIIDITVRASKPGGMVVLMDRGRDPTWLRCARLLSADPSWAHGSEALQPPPSTEARRTWTVAWCATPPPPPVWMSTAVQGYFRAWRFQSIHELTTVFRTDATYQRGPFSEPIVGIDGIVSYWTSRVLVQESPNPRVERVLFGFNTAQIEWRSEFRLHGCSRLVVGTMSLDFDPVEQRIAALREVFEVQGRM
jgi:SAM-dependent methyltransferase